MAAADLLLVVCPDVREHGVALLRGRGEGRHLADAGHGHLERARDRGRGHREDVDGRAQGLELLLVLDPEPLLLVDHDEAEVLEADLGPQQPMGPDDEVDAPVGQAGQDALGVAVALEPAERPHGHREGGVPLGEGLGVLLDEQGRRDEHGDLLAVLDGLERCPDGDLGLAVADVAADEPVHGDRPLHVGLDLVDAAQLVGGLDVGEGVLELALPRGVRPEGVPAGRHPGAVELDELGRDLADVPPRAALGLLPVRAAELVEGRRLTTDVAGDLVELVGRHVQPVPRLAPLGRGVLDDEVLPGRPADRPLDHLDEPAHTVLLVDDVVAGAQGQRVDLVPAARRHPPHLPGRRAGARRARQVGLGEHGDPAGGQDEPAAERGGGDLDDARHEVDRREGAREPGGDSLVGEHLGDAGRRSVAVAGDDDPPAVAQPGLEIGGGRLDVTAVGGGVLGARGDGAGVELGVGGERGEVPPRASGDPGVVAQVGERPERRRAEHRTEVDRHDVAGGRVEPGRLAELLARRDEVVGAATHPLGVADDDGGLRPQGVEQRLHAVDEGRRQGLHPLDGDAGRQLVEQLGDPRQPVGQGGGPRPDPVGEQDLAAGRRPEAVLGDVEAALVGDLEPAHLLDGVAPELHPDGVLRGGREDIEDPAADGELAAPLDQVGPGVCRCRERLDDLLHGPLVAHPQGHRHQLAEPRRDGLQDGPHRSDDDVEPAVCRVVGVGVRQPA